MAKSENQKLKLLYILQMLMQETDDEHGLSTEQIITRLANYGISAERKTVYSDIAALRDFGVDVQVHKGRETWWFVGQRDFDLPELKLLVDAVQASRFITVNKTNALIAKLESLTSRNEAKKLNRQVYVANRIKTRNERIFYAVDYIHDAIADGRQISFRYFDWSVNKEKVFRHNGKTYVVSPWQMCWADDNYYLIAYDSESGRIKHYRVDKMENIEVLKARRDGQECFKNFDMAVYSSKTFGMYGGREERVTLHCDISLTGVIVDRFGKDVSIRPAQEGFDVTVPVNVSPTFFGWVTNFGTKMKITQPAGVAAEYADHLRAIAEQY